MIARRHLAQSAISLALVAGCSGKVMNEYCAGGAAGSTGGASSSSCDFGTGGSTVYCPQLLAKYGNCVSEHLRSDVRNDNMLLIVDKSSSMSEPMPTSNSQDKWDFIVTSLAAVFTNIDGTNEDLKAPINLGLELFPFDPSSLMSLGRGDPQSMCQVPAEDAAIVVSFDPIVSRLKDVSDVLSAQTPGGLTPTAEALRQAYRYFTVGEGRCLRGVKWILLVTNGGANCNGGIACGSEMCTQNLSGGCPADTNCCDSANYLCQDDDSVIAAITQLETAHVMTFVAGIPDNAAAEASLNAYAIAGGMPNTNGMNGESYYPISESGGTSDLAYAIKSIMPQYVRSCDVELTPAPTNPASIRVYQDCIEVPPATGDGGFNGWVIDDSSDPAQLTFRGDACMALLYPGAKALDIYFDCPN